MLRSVIGAVVTALVAAAPAAAQTNPATDWNNYEKITLAPPGATTNGGPLDLAVMPDKKVLFTNRNGLLRLNDPATGVTTTVNTFSVYVGPEEGLQTVALDPNFAQNKWVYIFYSPVWQNNAQGVPNTNASPPPMTGNDPQGRPYPTNQPAGNSPSTMPTTTTPFDEPRCYPLQDGCQGAFPLFWQAWKGYNVLSRFKWNDTTQSLDMASEQQIIKVDAQRGQCCHLGTDVAWDSKGNLYLSTGDNTPSGAFGSGGLAPMSDDNPGVNPGVDARRSSGNTNDLRGKILRIKVKDDIASGTQPGVGSTYEVPAGNLREYTAQQWPAIAAQAGYNDKFRPEIYVMGLRNPFRIDIDKETDELTWGDYGPDNGNPTPLRGPMGVVEWQVTDRPMNGAWPYCMGSNSRTDDPNLTSDGPFGFSHNDFNFFTSTQGEWYDCNTPGALVNDSRWNTGLRIVPPGTPATAYYGDRVTDMPRREFFDYKVTGRNFQSPMGGPRYHYDASNPSPTKWPAHWDDKWFFYEFDNRYIAAMTTVDDANGVPQLNTMENVLPNAVLTANAVRNWLNVIDIEFGPDGSLYTIEYGNGGNAETGLFRTDYAIGNKTPQARISASPVSNSGAPLTVNFSAANSSDPESAALTYEWDFDGNGTWDATGVTATHTYTQNGAYTARLRVTDPSGKFGLAAQGITVGNQAPQVIINAPPEGSFFSWGETFAFNVTAIDAEDGATPACERMARTWSLGHNAHLHGISSGTGCTGAVTTVNDGAHPESEDTYGALEFTYVDAGAGGVGAASTTKTIVLQQKLQQGEFADELQGVTVVDDAAARGGRYVSSFNAGDHLAYSPVNFLNITGVRTIARGDGTLSLRWGAIDAPALATVNVNSSDWSTVTTTFQNVPAGTGALFVTSNGGVQVDAFEFVGDGIKDTVAPTVPSATLTPAQPNGQSGWYTSNVTLTLTATDNGAIASRQYSLNGGQTWTNTNNQGVATINTQGVNSILYRATDTAGNVSQVGGPLIVRLDSVAPATTHALSPAVSSAGVYDGPVTVTLTATDATSGVGSSEYAVDGGAFQPYTGPFQVGPGTHTVTYRTRDVAGNLEATKTTGAFNVGAVEQGTVGGTVPATLSLSLNAPATFGPFTPGVSQDYLASTVANVISSAGDAALTVADPSSNATGRLVNGSFSLPQPLQANAKGGAFAPVGGSANPTTLLTYSAPVSNDQVAIGFKQSIGSGDALRTGTYSKTLTFTLSTTTP